MKRLITYILAALMLLSFVAMDFGHLSYASTFEDAAEPPAVAVKSASSPTETPSPWAQEYVSQAISLGLVPEPLQSQYTRVVNRAEASSLIVAFYEAVTGEAIAGRITFIDTDDVNVEKAAYIGVVLGVGGNRFNPDGQFNREQAATMLARLSNALANPLPVHPATFGDTGRISYWALTAVGQLQATGIMIGTGSNFNPQQPYTREQSITTMLRLYDFIEGADQDTVKYVTDLQNSIPDAIPAGKVQLGWIAGGSGNTVENFDHAGLTNATVRQFSYQFENAAGTMKGRVQGDNGEIRIFALRTDTETPNGTTRYVYGQVRKVGDSYFRGPEGDTAADAHEIAVFEFAMRYVAHFATMTATAHDHINHTNHRLPTNRDSAERFPINTDYTAVANPERCLVFTYSRDDLGGMMSAMVYEGVVKYVTNLQNSIPDAIPAGKVQLGWIAGGSGNTVDNFNHAGLTDATVRQFSYQFENAAGTMKGRVQGNNGDIRIFALRTDTETPNGTTRYVYGQVRKVGDSYFRGPEGDTAADAHEIAVFEFAMRYVAHFATMTATAHDHINHTNHRLPTNRDSAERFPINTDYTAAANPERCLVFTYSRDDLGGMMSAMVYEGVVKYVTNLQNSIPDAIPAGKVQLGWIAGGSGNTVENFNHAGLTNATVRQFSYQFENADGSLKGRVQGNNGDIRIFALRIDTETPNGTTRYVYAQVRKVGDSYFRGPEGDTAADAHEIAVFEFAMQFVAHFATMTATGHDHINHTGHKLPTDRDSAERFPINTDYTAAANPDRCIVFTYSRDDLGGMMSAMVIPAR